MREDIKKRIEAVRREEIPEGYKRSHPYTIPEDWKVEKLGTITKCTSRPNKDGQERQAYSINNRKGFVPQSEQFEEGSYQDLDKSAYKIVRKGEFAYNPARVNVGSIGRLRNEDEVIVSSLYVCVSVDEVVDGEYFDAWTKSRDFYKETVRNTEGSVREYLFYENFANMRIPLPHLAEQQKIAEILATCDRVIELKQQLLEEKRRQKQWLMQKLLDPDSGVRLRGYNSKWNKHRLGSLGSTYSGLSGKNEDDFGEGTPYIPYVNIFANPIVDTEHFDYVRIGNDEKQSCVHHGDIFFTTSSETPNEVGMSSVYLGADQELYLNSFCFGFRLNTFDVLAPEYAAYCFRGPALRKILNILAQGATRYNLSKADFMKQSIILPPTIEEQIEIANVLLTADCEIETCKKELEEWEKKKKALMQLLLTGLVRVNV